MLIGFLFAYILIVPLINGDEKGEIPKRTLPVPKKIQDEHNKTKIAIASEGGAIIPIIPVLNSLPEDNQGILMTSDNGSSSNKVKARKGAVLNLAEDSENPSVVKENNGTVDSNPHIKTDKTSNIINTTKVLNSSDTSVHKPRVVSVEAIAKADEKNSDPAVDDVNERNVKVPNINSIGHPGMVMPVVITILVVPMFAVIGYMAMKRGKEAWKNRHYKRMDFLLDGMYND